MTNAEEQTHRARVTEARKSLDSAIESAIPLAGGRVRGLLEELQSALTRTDETNAAVAR